MVKTTTYLRSDRHLSSGGGEGWGCRVRRMLVSLCHYEIYLIFPKAPRCFIPSLPLPSSSAVYRESIFNSLSLLLCWRPLIASMLPLKTQCFPTRISLASIHQHFKNNANTCICSIALVSKIACIILKIDQNLLLTVQTSFVYLLCWGFQVFETTEWRIDAELS